MEKNFKEVENEILTTEVVDFSEDIEVVDEMVLDEQDTVNEIPKVSLEEFCTIASKTA